MLIVRDIKAQGEAIVLKTRRRCTDPALRRADPYRFSLFTVGGM